MPPATRPGRARALRFALALLSAVALGAAPLLAGGNPSNEDFKPAGAGDGTANGDYITSTGGLQTAYHYFIEVPPGSSRLVVDLFDADVNSGGATENTADRDSNDSTATQAVYTLLDPSGATVPTNFTLGTSSAPIGADNAWLTFFDSSVPVTAPAFGSAGATTTKGNDGVGTIDLPLPAGISAGNLLLAVVVRGGGGAPGISTPSGWTAISEANSGGTTDTDIRLGVFYRIATGTETSPLTVTLGATRETIGAVLRYTGVDTTNPIGANGFSNGNSTTPLAPSVTTTIANTRVFRVAGDGDNKTPTTPTGNTSRFAGSVNASGGLGVGAAGADATFVGPGGTGSAQFTITGTAENWRAGTIALRAPAPPPTAGHWELVMDMSGSTASPAAENAYSIRAHDGDTSSGGTEYNVYYDSHTEYGLIGTLHSPTKSYDVYPYITSGCTAFENDFDYDVGNGVGGGTAGQEFGRIELWTRSHNTSSSSADRQQDIQSSVLSPGDTWNRETITAWTSDAAAVDYGIWHSIVRISTQNSGGGNLANVWFADFESASPIPASNPTPNAYRVYLPRDGGGPPAEPYLEQVEGYESGPNPPVSGQTTTVTVTVRVSNPTPFPITFSGTTTADDIVVADLPGDARVAYSGASAQASCGSVASQPADGATSGSVLWNPGSVAAGTTCILAYDVRITPTGSGQRIRTTQTANIDSVFASAQGTRARFVDATGNTTQARARATLGPICELAVTSDQPTYSVVTSFTAAPLRHGGAVEWRTATEDRTAGYYLYRWDRRVRDWTLVQPGLILADSFAPAGAVYRTFDAGAGSDPIYALVELEIDGQVRRYGPFRTAADAPKSAAKADLAAGFDASLAYSRRAIGPDEVALARLSRSRIAAQRGATATLSPAPARALKLHLLEAGLYRMEAADLAARFGLPEAAIRARIAGGGFALTHRGAKVAWLPADDDSALLFVGQPPADELEADSVYRLALGAGPTMPARGVAAAPTAPAGASPDRVNTEQDAIPVVVLPLDPAAGFWFMDQVGVSPPDTTTRDYPVDAPDPAGNGRAELEVRLYGDTSFGVENEHEVGVDFNGLPLGTTSWSGLAPRVVRYPIDPSRILPAGNVVTLHYRAGDGAPSSTVLVDGFALEYTRSHHAIDDRLAFRDVGATAVTGFTRPDVLLLDVSDPGRPVVLKGAAVEPDAGGGWDLGFADDGGLHDYLAVTPAAARAPLAIEADRPSALRAARGAEYVVIVPDFLAPAAQALAARRAGQGLSTMVARLADVEDEFDSGIHGPRAISRFLAWAWNHWPVRPRYAVLVGDGSYDLRDRLGYGGDLVPPLMVSTLVGTGGVVAADAGYGDVDGDGLPEIEVGRLPALVPGDVVAFVHKLDLYEGGGAGDWAGRAALAADAPGPGSDDFELDAQAVAPHIAPAMNVDSISIAALGHDAAHARLLGDFAAGIGWLDYFGHGGLQNLSSPSLLSLDDVDQMTNLGRTPVVTAMSCLINRFEVPDYRILGEELVRSPAGGAIAVWAPAGKSDRGEARQLGIALADAAFHTPDQRLGDVLHEAVRRYLEVGGDADLARLYVLLGDPATLVPAPVIQVPPSPSGGEN
jgi:hypothetical protein